MRLLAENECDDIPARLMGHTNLQYDRLSQPKRSWPAAVPAIHASAMTVQMAGTVVQPGT